MKDRIRPVFDIAGGRALGYGCEFVALALIARAIGPADYGNFAFFVAIAIVSAQLFDLGLGRILTIRASWLIGAKAGPGQVGSTYGSLLGIRLYGGMLLAPVLVLLAVFARQWYLLACGLAMGFLVSTLQCVSSIFQSELRFRRYSISIFLPGVGKLIAVVLLTLTGHATLGLLVVLYPSVQLAALLALSFLVPWSSVDLGAVLAPRPHLQPLLDFGKWLMIAAIFEVAYLKADVIILKALGTAHDLGIYAAAFTFAGVFSLLLNSVIPNYVPRMCRAAGQGRLDEVRAYYAETTDLLAIIVIPSAVGLWALAPDLLPAIFGSQYYPSVHIWSILVIYALLIGINSTGTVFFALQKLHIVTALTALVLASNVIIGTLLVPRWGAAGAAWAVSVSQVLNLVISVAAAYMLIGIVPVVPRILYYAASALLFFPVVRWVHLPVVILSIALKVAVGAAVYGTVVLLGRRYLFRRLEPAVRPLMRGRFDAVGSRAASLDGP